MPYRRYRRPGEDGEPLDTTGVDQDRRAGALALEELGAVLRRAYREPQPRKGFFRPRAPRTPLSAFVLERPTAEAVLVLVALERGGVRVPLDPSLLQVPLELVTSAVSSLDAFHPDLLAPGSYRYVLATGDLER